ncbi:MAG: Maf family protein [Eubacteriales bacterium]
MKIDSIQQKEIILASGSPRRKELLMRMGVDFDIMLCDAEEIYDENMPPAQIVEFLAKQKAEIVNKMAQGRVVIGADTVVSIGEHILGKPADQKEAYDMIKKLSGNWHDVITGICIFENEEYLLEHEITKVHFVDMTEDEIKSYINTDEPYDKAGAYGIQGLAGMYIDRIEGDFYNIMGFPMAKVRNMLKSINAVGDMKGNL